MKKLLFFIVFVLSTFRLYAQYTAIPDPNFEQELINQGFDTDLTINGHVLTSDINAITSLTMNNSVSGNILNLAGIDGFTALEELIFSAGSLQTISLNQNQNLKKIFLISPQITNLNISNNLALETLYIYYANQLNFIDISNNINLKDLAIGNFNLTQLNLSNNIYLEKLRITYTQISQLDITFNTALKYIYFGSNPITAIDVSHNVLLEELRIFNCLITSIDVSQNIVLKLLGTSTNALQSIDVSNNPQLETLYCINNLLTSLNLNNNSLLNKMLCNNYDGSFQNNISLLYLQNGNNYLLNNLYDIGSGSNPPTFHNRFDSTNNPNLHCIFVDDVANCNTNWLGKDATSNYVTTQQECDNLQNEEFSANLFAIYPNPVNDLLFIENNNSNPIQKIIVYDLIGKTILVQNGNSKQLNFSNFPRGLYLIKITTDKETIVKKIVKK
jgi:hypothetical protein